MIDKQETEGQVEEKKHNGHTEKSEMLVVEAVSEILP